MTVLTRSNLALPSMASMVGNRGRTEGVTSAGHLLAVDSLPDRADFAYKRLEGVLA